MVTVLFAATAAALFHPPAHAAPESRGISMGGTSSATRAPASLPETPPAGRIPTTRRAFHVATTGSDSIGNGSISKPWRTIQFAQAQLVEGDTLFVRGGSYAGFSVTVSGTGVTSVRNPRFPTASDHPITIRGFPGETVVIDGDLGKGGSRGIIEIRARDYIIIDGFVIRNGTTDCVYIEGASDQQRGHHIVRHCTVHTCGNSGIYVCGRVMSGTPALGEYRTVDILIEDNEVSDTNNPDRIYPWNIEGSPNTGGNECITIGGGVDGVTVRRNRIRDSFQYGIDFKLQVRNFEASENEIFHLRAHGVYLDAACRPLENGLVARNLIHDCNGNAITLAREAARGPAQGYEQNTDNIEIVGNVSVRCNRGLLIYKHPKDNLAKAIRHVHILHNTFYNSRRENVRLVDLASIVMNFVFANNLYTTPGPGFPNLVNQFTNTFGYVEVGNVTSNPGWIAPDATPPNLRIPIGSTAKGAGSAKYAIPLDLDGKAYSSPPAAGAFEAVP